MSGVIGVGRGRGFAGNARHVGMELVALRDHWEEKLVEVGKSYPGVATYTDYDKFLEHDMDAVISESRPPACTAGTSAEQGGDRTL